MNDRDETLNDPKMRCPRCGYDLRGVVAQWGSQCDVDGRCTECGLDFAWGEIMRPHAFLTRWFVEYEPRVRRLPRSILRTFVSTAIPKRFWSRLRMSHDIRWRRIVIYLFVIFLLPPLTTYVAIQTSAALWMRVQIQKTLNEAVADQQERVDVLQSRLDDVAAEKVDLPEETVGNWVIWLEQAKKRLTATTGIEPSMFEIVMQAVFTPTSEKSIGQFVSMGAVYPYPTPVELYDSRRYTRRTRSWFTLNFQSLGLFWTRPWLPSAMLAVFISATVFPIMFAALPITRRRAKVRWGHIGRVFCYSLSIPAAASIVTMLILFCYVFFPQSAAKVVVNVPLGSAVVFYTVCLAALGHGWRRACAEYLRIPHAVGVAAMLSIVAVLVLLLILAVLTVWSPAALPRFLYSF